MFQKINGTFYKNGNMVKSIKVKLKENVKSDERGWRIADVQLQEGASVTEYTEHVAEMERVKKQRVVYRYGGEMADAKWEVEKTVEGNTGGQGVCEVGDELVFRNRIANVGNIMIAQRVTDILKVDEEISNTSLILDDDITEGVIWDKNIITIANGLVANLISKYIVKKGDKKIMSRINVGTGMNDPSDSVELEVIEPVSGFVVKVNPSLAGVNKVTFPWVTFVTTGVIKWGDGGQDDVGGWKNANHTYTTPGEYIVTFEGELEKIDLSGNSYVTEIVTPFPSTIANLDYAPKCGNRFLSKVPYNLFYNLPGIKSFYYTFEESSSLEGIPFGLFDKSISAESFEGCFSFSGIKTIPDKLFSKCESLKVLKSTFSNCKQLTSVPANIIDDCANINSLLMTFFNCTGITDTLPEWWLDARFGDLSISLQCFYGCYNASNYNDIPNSWK